MRNSYHNLFWTCPTKILILEYIYKNIGRKKSKISKDLNIGWVSVHKILKNLEEFGLLKEINKIYSLTPKGKEITNYLLEIDKILKND